MKKKGDKTNRTTSVLYYFSAVCFYICAIINFVDNGDLGVVYLCLGSAFLCLGSVYLNKDKDKNKK